MGGGAYGVDHVVMNTYGFQQGKTREGQEYRLAKPKLTIAERTVQSSPPARSIEG